MEPRIQYTRTSDGVSIAYWSLGEGPPLISMPPLPWCHLELEWQDAEYGRFYETLSSGLRLVHYDSRGSGLSDREPADVSPGSFLLDVEAVADKLGLEKFALMGVSPSTANAVMFAAKHPERVTHLVLWVPELVSLETTPLGAAFAQLFEGDFHQFTQTIAHALVAGWSAPAAASTFAELMRAAVDQATAIRIYRSQEETLALAKAALPNVRCPALILYPRGLGAVSVEQTRDIAAAMPDAQIVFVEGSAHLPWLGDMQRIIGATYEFLGLPEPAVPEKAAAVAAPAAGLATILFTDMEGSTGLTQRLGDADAQEMVRAHNSIVRTAIRRHGGSEVKHTGDGIMASFTLASAAIRAAIDIQRAVETHNREHPGASFRVRVGLNAGEPVAEESDLFGTAVQLAARVCAKAEPGRVLVSDVVRQLAAGKGFLFEDLGETVLRGFEDPARLYEVRWRD